jgi:hypothetical protein
MVNLRRGEGTRGPRREAQERVEARALGIRGAGGGLFLEEYVKC